MERLYAATGDDFALLVPDGDAWRVRVTLRQKGVQCLAIDPRHSETVYAGSRGTGVLKSLDGGMTWEALPLPEKDVFSVAVSAADGSVYAGCEPSRLFQSRDGGASWTELSSLREIPSAPTWSFPPRPWTSHVRWIAPNPHDPDVILVGIELGGVMYSQDGGKTWRDHPPEAVKDCHALAWHPLVPGRAYEAGGGGGAAWSRDGGKTWERTDQGLDRLYGWGLAVDPKDPDLWYLSASPGARYAHHSDGDARAYIYRRRGQGSWERLTKGLPLPLDHMPYALLALEDGEVLAGLSNGRLYRSTDYGDSWAEVPLRGDSLTCIRAMTAAEA